ncbi:MAG: DUF418 domain-containing protein [Chitinophagaceae bacterium]|nr:DUF418 domain-containing protein [Chitinophagaceae bacterium]
METTLPISAHAPLPRKERIQLLDAIRGIAVLGILLMNITGQGQAGQLYDTMDVRLPLTGANFYAWAGEMFFFEGTMRGLFSILFGAGTLLLINRLQKKNQGLVPADIYYRRLLWLLVFGLINAFIFLWPGDILYSYAVAGLLLFPFRNLSATKLLVAAFIVLVIASYFDNRNMYDKKEVIVKGREAEKLSAQNKPLTDEQKEFLGKWSDFRKNGSKDSLPARLAEEEKKIVGKNYAEVFKVYKNYNVRNQSFGFYAFIIWDVLLFFFIGMAVYKSGFLTGDKSTGLYVLVAVVGIGVGLLISYYDLSLNYRLQFDRVAIREQQVFDFYAVRRVFLSLGYLSLLSLLYKTIAGKKVLGAFAPLGQMAFTNYLLQSIITSIYFYGFHKFATLQRYELYYVVAAIWVFEFIFSTIWLRYFSFGPFEWIWRSLTYWKRFGIRRRDTSVPTI